MIKAIIKNDDYNQNSSRQPLDDCNVEKNVNSNVTNAQPNEIVTIKNVEVEKNATTLSRLKKLKNVKHFELIIAFGVALVAII
ncbi:MAG: hypothetical protein RSB61_04415, partial [Clostridia bacterium]